MSSKLPWKIELEHQGIRGRKENITIVAARGIVARIGDTSMPGAMDDAELIVRAVNAHEAGVLALEMAQADYEASYIALYHSVGNTVQQRVDCEQRLAVIKAALAKARA
jgi:hypothetical protein